MYRSGVTARRLIAAPRPRVPRKPTPGRGQSYSSQAGEDGPGFTRQQRFVFFSVLGGGVIWYASRKRRVTVAARHREKSRRDNELPEISGVDVDGPVGSSVKVVDWAEVSSMIRKQATSFKFDGHRGAQGRIDTVRFESNSPTEDEWAVGVGAGVAGGKTIYAGVYDGHAGWACSAVLQKKLIPYVSATLAPLASSAAGDAIDTAIQKAFCKLDDKIMTAGKDSVAGSDPFAAEAVSALAPAIAGSCALLTMYDTETCTLRTAVTGDSRAVIGSWSAAKKAYSAEALSKDQTGFNEDEVRRIAELHPGEKDEVLDPKSGRLMGLAVTRAFGDHRWKYENELVKTIQHCFGGSGPRPQSKTPPYLTASPEVTTRKVQGDDFVIMASDGLWDVISNDDAVACVSQWLKEKKKAGPKHVVGAKSNWEREDGWATYKATPKYFAIEDMDNAAVCLLKNALGGTRREMIQGLATAPTPLSRNARDDMTIQVIFFNDPYKN